MDNYKAKSLIQALQTFLCDGEWKLKVKNQFKGVHFVCTYHSVATGSNPKHQGWARSIGEASPILTENRDRDFFFVLISTEIEIGIFFRPDLDFASRLGSLNLLEKSG